MLYLFFFFKQKTAYEMRISDWSSDVCSSDLTLSSTLISISSSCLLTDFAAPVVISRLVGEAHEPVDRVRIHHRVAARGLFERPAEQQLAHRRSEEHTSELQSLMRISYAVFCLKKKTQKTNHQANHNIIITILHNITYI